MTVGDLAFFALLAIAFLGAVFGQAFLMGAREQVRIAHPDWYARLSDGGRSMRLGGPDDRARRRLFWPLALGRLPPGPAGDPALAALAARFRLAMTAVALAFAGIGIILALRAGGGTGAA
jgi:hypothetical protein